MKTTKTKLRTGSLSEAHIQQLRRDRELIAKELPDLIAKHQRICDAKEEPTMSGALRRAIHSSKILLDDLADQAGTDLSTLDAFLTGERPLTSDLIDRLTKILKLKLASANGKPKARRAKAG